MVSNKWVGINDSFGGERRWIGRLGGEEEAERGLGWRGGRICLPVSAACGRMGVCGLDEAEFVLG